MDSITAFLNGQLSEEIFMEIPEGFPSARDPMKVCKIFKALYSLKQAPKAWYECINSCLLNQGLVHTKNDPNLYFSRKDSKLIILLLYIDNLLITGDNHSEIAQLKLEL